MSDPVHALGAVRPSNGVFARLFDGELLIVDLARGEYFALDEVGARLWDGIEKRRAIEQVAREITAEYDVAFERALTDLRTLVADLVARKLVVADRTERGDDR
jgi:hypothetical protein